jgi:hypothetical protein
MNFFMGFKKDDPWRVREEKAQQDQARAAANRIKRDAEREEAEAQALADQLEARAAEPRKSADELWRERIEAKVRPLDPRSLPPLEKFAAIKRQRAEAIISERRAAERQAREDELGLPGQQAAWQAARDQITAGRDQAVREAGEMCREAERAARERCDNELADLGARPELRDVEVMRV